MRTVPARPLPLLEPGVAPLMTEPDLVWTFGYGSLMWRPGFEPDAFETARLVGFQRRLCIRSEHYRGTAEQPGLVFGLARGGSCRGMVFEVEDQDWPDVQDYLRAREQVTMVYRDVHRPVRLDDGRTVQALAFLVDERHEQFAGRLALEAQLAMVRQGVGLSGRNVDYVLNTARHLEQLGIRDRQVMELAALLAAEELAA